MNTHAIAAEIRSFCSTHGDPKQIVKYARFFREGYDAFGLSQPVFEKQRDVWLEKYRGELGLAGFLELGDCLIKTGKYEEASYAISFIIPFKKEWTKETFQRVGNWLEQGIGNWAHSDFLCGEVLKPCLAQKVVAVSDMKEWRKSGTKWKRRAVPVALLAFVKTPEKIASLLKFIRPMMLDNERVVHQGLGWFLREAWKANPKAVEPFLLEWKDSAPRLIFQYATEKMTPRQKARYKARKLKD
ncbi:DNA alkylation repair protein [bacterium]|nr:MAG: DNA alkylation repair protein [bacterium]